MISRTTPVVVVAIAVALFSCSGSQLDGLVSELGALPATLGPQIRSDGRAIDDEVARSRLYTQLYYSGEAGVLALGRGLRHEDVQIRRNSALALFALGFGFYPWGDIRLPKLDISPALQDLEGALVDDDARVRASAAQAIGQIGPAAGSAVMRLIDMLDSDVEGDRNSACIALRFIGPPAIEALPALRGALSDPSEHVRRSAELAIAAIETG